MAPFLKTLWKRSAFSNDNSAFENWVGKLTSPKNQTNHGISLKEKLVYGDSNVQDFFHRREFWSLYIDRKSKTLSTRRRPRAVKDRNC